MEPGYSKILINDCIVEDEGAAWQHVALDMFMMAQLAARERTEREWHALIESCGLKIVGIYNKGQGNEGLIEVVSELAISDANSLVKMASHFRRQL
ncbi:hypothetical protein PFICI_02300 [Pestalotiopsis fici W106-1]|uniref:O-methyltransferase C-terminal domain-containing protein n=1 Tax=Pestalotiopsis fici (strain W106-1 / CGMCC3.15140) TaxID=1229662 RepID=W3XE09_PESFW|nr:uncharacterized protein PFICI_02300 [Pestalotiopsis fici W106-1]ETS84275.1 hypothetical protein PFICI_02300 [Pestalotiopsis fici W106-1]